MMVRRIKWMGHRVADRFFAILDSEGVAFFQTLVYTHLAVGGAYCLIIARAVPDTVSGALGDAGDTTWLMLCMAATICIAGKVMSWSYRRYWVRTGGLYLQFAGDVCAFGSFAGYVFSTWQESDWGQPLVAVWVFAALADCAFFLCWRDLRRIREAEKAGQA